MNLSIIIPVFNKSFFTDNCLKNLMRLPHKEYQIIVFDNGSRDDTSDVLNKYECCMDNLICIRSAKNLGFGKAINLAMQKCVADRIMILNNDLDFSHMSDIDIETWPVSFLSCGPMVFAGPTAGLVNKNFDFLYETNDFSKPHNYLSGWCLCAMRDTWDALHLESSDGPFDSENFFVYFEDTDLGFRAIKRGISFMQIDVLPKHIGKVTSSTMNTGNLYRTAKRRFCRKWKGKYYLRP